MSKLGFALLGCGRIAPKHVDALTSGAVPGAKLVAVCDEILPRAEAIAAKLKIPAFRDRFEMLEKMGSEIDVVSVLTPSGLHARHAVDIAGFRKHIVVEKPMALTLQDADRMIAAADANGVRMFVVKQNRYNHPVKKLREALDGGRFGKLVMGTVRVRWCRTQKYYDQDAWRGTWAYDGGVFANQASHHVDLLQWMMGDVESVFAKTSTALVNIETEDTGVVLVRFKSGALGVIEATTATRPKDLEGSLSILGEKGTVEIAGFAVNEMKTWNFTEPAADDATVVEKYQTAPPNVYGFGHTEYLNKVVESIREERSALVDGLEGRKSLELISAIYESVETGKEVFLRFVPKMCKLGQIREEGPRA
ncbi:MAG TPA: Gfo/Idh/MocA family oxidoreductase [Bdellovibrionales bacterium]|nr:Gfo/Idh/MocA family oxidoreductase [Bdellovibrionales bacterium]